MQDERGKILKNVRVVRFRDDCVFFRGGATINNKSFLSSMMGDSKREHDSDLEGASILYFEDASEQDTKFDQYKASG